MSRLPTEPRGAMRYTTFCERLLGVEFYPAQWVAFAVLFDALEPRQLEGERRELARQIFGEVETVPPEARRVAVMVKGARVGGTRFSMTRLVHLAATLAVPTTAPGEALYALVVGPDMRLARQALAYALGAIKSQPDLAERLGSETQDTFEFLRDDGRTVLFTALPATAGGSAVRGRTLVGAVMTEAAYFRDSFSVINDQDIYRAIAPRVAPGGQVIIESTPWAELGMLYQLWDVNFGKPTGAIVAHCPTLLMRPDPEMARHVAAERARDPDAAAQEFDAGFRAAGASVFLDPKAVDACADDDLRHPAPFDPQAGKASAADFGFTSDASALTILQTKGGRAWLAFADELKPMPGYPLQPSEVCRRFARHMRGYGSRELILDGHYVESIREHMAPFGRLFPAPAGSQGKLEAHVACREMIHEKQVRIPRLPRLIAQLKGLVSKPQPGGGLRIEFPRRRAGGLLHGDIASAFVLSCWAIKSTRVSSAERERWAAEETRMKYAASLVVGNVPPEDVARVYALAHGGSGEDIQVAMARVAERDASGRKLSGMGRSDFVAHNAMLRRIGSPVAMSDDAIEEHFRRQGAA